VTRTIAFDQNGWQDYAWSRRIDEVNRLVYYVTDDHIVILQAREHY